MIQLEKKPAMVQSAQKMKEEGHATFNNCDHTFVDLSNQGSMHTISVLLPNGQYVTLCNIKTHDTGAGCIDIKVHGEELTHKVLGFSAGSQASMSESLYSLDYKK